MAGTFSFRAQGLLRKKCRGRPESFGSIGSGRLATAMADLDSSLHSWMDSTLMVLPMSSSRSFIHWPKGVANYSLTEASRSSCQSIISQADTKTGCHDPLVSGRFHLDLRLFGIFAGDSSLCQLACGLDKSSSLVGQCFNHGNLGIQAGSMAVLPANLAVEFGVVP